jgi:hypothetical protein
MPISCKVALSSLEAPIRITPKIVGSKMEERVAVRGESQKFVQSMWCRRVGFVRINGAHSAAVLMFGAAALTPVTVCWFVRASAAEPWPIDTRSEREICDSSSACIHPAGGGGEVSVWLWAQKKSVCGREGARLEQSGVVWTGQAYETASYSVIVVRSYSL